MHLDGRARKKPSSILNRNHKAFLPKTLNLFKNSNAMAQNTSLDQHKNTIYRLKNWKRLGAGFEMELWTGLTERYGLGAIFCLQNSDIHYFY